MALLFGRERDLTAPAAVLGLAHHRAGRMEEAAACYDACLADEPDHPRLLGLLGQAQIACGKFADGLRHLGRAHALMPDHDETLLAFANATARGGDYPAALGLYRALLSRSPQSLAGAQNMIAVLRALGDFTAMAQAAKAALFYHPGQAQLRLALALADLRGREVEGALARLDDVLREYPDLAEAHFLRGTALNMMGRSEEAVDAFYCTLALAPDHAPAHLNMGNACADLERPDLAVEYARKALAIDPGLVEAYASLGYFYTRLCRLDEAMAACRTALLIAPDHVQAHWNLGIAALLAGDWELGWRQYEWRKRPELYAEHFRIPEGEEWRGGPLAGRTLTICAEQGLGDAIHLARYFPLLRARGARLILSCAQPLLRLLASHPDLCAVQDRAQPLPAADLWVDQMSLPGLLATRVDGVPGASAYLCADPVLVDRWRARLPGGRKIGLVWAGNALHSNDRRRSMPSAMLEPLLEAGDAQFVSLQLGREFPARWQGRVFDAAPWLDDFAETAACVSCLDLVIAVDTSTAHLCGALGRDVWVMLPFSPDWRWLLGRSDTPWYRSMRLFRQKHAGDWGGVIEDVTRALKGLLGDVGC